MTEQVHGTATVTSTCREHRFIHLLRPKNTGQHHTAKEVVESGVVVSQKTLFLIILAHVKRNPWHTVAALIAHPEVTPRHGDAAVVIMVLG